MKPLDIQFARPARAFGWARATVVMIGVLALVASAARFVVTRGELERAEAELGDIRSQLDRRNALPVGAAVAIPENQIRAINAAIGKLNLPWAELFAVFEASKPAAIALLSYEPDGRSRTLVVQAESRTLAHMVAFVERLRRVAMFEEALLVRHELREDDPNRPYRFVLKLRWREGI